MPNHDVRQWDWQKNIRLGLSSIEVVLRTILIDRILEQIYSALDQIVEFFVVRTLALSVTLFCGTASCWRMRQKNLFRLYKVSPLCVWITEFDFRFTALNYYRLINSDLPFCPYCFTSMLAHRRYNGSDNNHPTLYRSTLSSTML